MFATIDGKRTRDTPSELERAQAIVNELKRDPKTAVVLRPDPQVYVDEGAVEGVFYIFMTEKGNFRFSASHDMSMALSEELFEYLHIENSEETGKEMSETLMEGLLANWILQNKIASESSPLEKVELNDSIISSIALNPNWEGIRKEEEEELSASSPQRQRSYVFTLPSPDPYPNYGSRETTPVMPGVTYPSPSRSRSPSPARYSRSRSPSPARFSRSRSPSAARFLRSRSPSPGSRMPSRSRSRSRSNKSLQERVGEIVDFITVNKEKAVVLYPILENYVDSNAISENAKVFVFSAPGRSNVYTYTMSKDMPQRLEAELDDYFKPLRKPGISYSRNFERKNFEQVLTRMLQLYFSEVNPLQSVLELDVRFEEASNRVWKGQLRPDLATGSSGTAQNPMEVVDSDEVVVVPTVRPQTPQVRERTPQPPDLHPLVQFLDRSSDMKLEIVWRGRSLARITARHDKGSKFLTWGVPKAVHGDAAWKDILQQVSPALSALSAKEARPMYHQMDLRTSSQLLAYMADSGAVCSYHFLP